MSLHLSRTCIAMALAACGAWLPAAVSAQGFAADYELSRFAPVVPEEGPLKALGLGGLRLAPAIQSEGSFSGAGLSLASGQNWFAQVTVGRSIQHLPGLANGTPLDSLQLGGGYRWADGQSLSLHLTGGKGGSRMGLSLRYDWPQYFLRLAVDPRVDLGPVDTLRFSAGMRF